MIDLQKSFRPYRTGIHAVLDIGLDTHSAKYSTAYLLEKGRVRTATCTELIFTDLADELSTT